MCCTITTTMSEIMKRKKGQILNNNERQLILNLMNYLREKNSEKSISEVIREISKATGCSERTIYKIRKEASKGITVIASRTRQRKKENKNSRNVKYDSFVKSSIRKKVHNYFLQNIPPTLNAILCLVNSDPDLPNFKRSTLHTLLKEIGFAYEQKGKKSVLTERNDLVKSRQQYLRDIRKFRNENRWIVYTGETLISLMKKEVKKTETLDNFKERTLEIIQPQLESAQVPCQTINTLFVNAPDIINGTTLVYTIDTTSLPSTINDGSLGIGENVTAASEIACNTDNIPIHTIITDNSLLMGESSQSTKSQLEDLKTDKKHVESADDAAQKNLSERELRLTIMHAGSDRGFIEGADLVTLSKKKNEEMESYEQWFVEKLLPKIPPNSVIVTDNNAPYHKRVEENIPDGSWKKQQIKNWLLSKNVKIGHVNQKKELLAIVNDLKPLYSTKHKIDEIAKQKGITIVSLPAFHYELNPLNMVWAQIKYYVRSNMRSFKIKKIKRLVKEGFYAITQVNWMNYTLHVKQMEDLLWAVDELQESNQHVNTSQGNDEGRETKMLM